MSAESDEKSRRNALRINEPEVEAFLATGIDP